MHCGVQYHPDMNCGFPNAVVGCSENGSMTASEFGSIYKEVFIDDVRPEEADVKADDEIIVWMDSGGGNAFQQH